MGQHFFELCEASGSGVLAVEASSKVLLIGGMGDDGGHVGG